MYFRNEAGQTISGSDSHQDGIIQLSISSNTVWGDYYFDYLRIHDDNYNANQVQYNKNGIYEKRTWDLDDNNWDYFRSISDIDLTGFKISVVEDTSPFDDSTDFLPPVIESFNWSGQETVEAGDRFYLHYEATDFAQKLDADGERLFGIKDPDLFDVDGNYTGTEHSAILARASNNNVIWDTDGPRFYLTDTDGNIVYDGDDPVLAFPILTDEVGSDIKWLNAHFRSEDGLHSFNIDGYWDYGNDGVMTFRPGDNQPNGVYSLNDITIYDLAYSQNYITYNKGGNVYYNDAEAGSRSLNDYHDLDFESIQIEVVESTDTNNQVQTDDIAPILNGISFLSEDAPFEISGTADDDIMYGSLFDDIINGLTGDDVLTGGKGSDIFEFTVGFGSDVITDFELGVDKISILDENGTQLTLAEYSDLGFSNIEGGGIKITHEDLDGDITLEDLTGGPSLDFFEII